MLGGGVLSFGLAHYGTSVFELLAEELLMSDSTIKVSLIWFSTLSGNADAAALCLFTLDMNISVLLLSASFLVM